MSQSSSKAEKTSHDASALRILLVEEHEDDFIFIRDMLSAASVERVDLVWAAGCEAARAKLSAGAFDLYLVNQRLVDGSGVDFVKEIVAVDSNASIIMLTGMESRALDLAAMEAGVFDFLVKGQLTPVLLDRGVRYALERKRSETALQESEQRFRDMLAASSDWFWETDAKLRYTEISNRFFDSTGLSPASVIGADFHAIIGKVTSQDKLESLSAQLRSSMPFRDFEFAVECQHNDVRWVRVSGFPVTDDDGKVNGYRGTGTDITNEVSAKRTAALAQIRLADAIASISEGFALWDTSDRLVLFNHRYLEEFGNDTDILQIGISFRDLINERVRRGHISNAVGNEAAWIEERIAQHKACTGTREIRLLDGRWIRVTERRTKEGSTAVIRADITELKEREQALQASERRFRDMLEATSDWYWEWSADFLPVYVSQKYFEVTGHLETDVIGKPADTHYITGADPEAVSIYEKALSKRQTFRRFMSPVQCADGGTVWILLSGKPVFSEQGDFLGYRGTGADITEGIRIKHAAELAQKRLLDAIECIPGGFLLCDNEDRLVLWNRRYADSHGENANMFEPGTPYEKIVRSRAELGKIPVASGREEDWVKERLAQHRNPTSPVEIEIDKDQWVRVMEHRTSEGGIVSIRTDISEMKLREAMIAKSERIWRAIFDNATVGIASFSPEKMVIAANDTLCKLVGRNQTSLKNRNQSDLVYPADNELFEKLIQSALVEDHEKARPIELRLVHADGYPVWVDAEVATVRGVEGEPDYFVAVVRDISQTKHAETEISRLGRIIDESINEVYIFDSETLKFVQVNRGARENLRYSTGELTNMTPLDLKPDYDDASFRALLEPLLNGTNDHIHFETRHLRKDGSLYPVEVHLQISRSDIPPLFVAIIRDLSERKESETRLRQAQKMEAIGQLAGGIAHDFNNVLTVISGNLSLLSRELMGEFPDKDWDDLLDDALSAANRARELTKGLLSVSRKDPMVRADVGVEIVIDEVQKLLRRTLPPNISISVETDTGARYAFTDENQLHTALLNLGLNARDAMPEGGRLSFRTRGRYVSQDDEKQGGLALGPGHFLAIEVTDTGIGMEPQVAERVLDPLFTTKSPGKGTGLGLTMVSSFAQESGGDVIIDSKPGQGSTFTLLLPMATTDSVRGERSQKRIVTTTTSHARILVCDDEHEILRFVGRCLERVGYEVILAMDAEQTLDMIRQDNHIAALLSDIQLPGKMDGIALVDEVLRVSPELPVMLMTASSIAAEAACERFQDRVPLLKKPFSVEEISDAVEKLISEHHPAADDSSSAD